MHCEKSLVVLASRQKNSIMKDRVYISFNPAFMGSSEAAMITFSVRRASSVKTEYYFRTEKIN
jgi:hypothetical protein